MGRTCMPPAPVRLARCGSGPRRAWASRVAVAWGGIALAAQMASACTIPVFRYALDRWEADAFRLVVPESASRDRDMLRLLAPLRGNAIANVRVDDAAAPAADRARLLFPADDTPLWEGPLDASAVQSLLDSPARRALVERLLAGESVVWVVAAGSRYQAEVERIGSRLRFLERVAELPAQNPADPDSQLGPGPPLRLKFSVLGVSRDDPAEQLFLRMLAGPAHAELAQGGVSFAAAVFGRGRVLGAWPVEELDDVTIEDTSLFLTGRCSCRVKNGNPGWDLLLQVDWERALAEAEAETAADHDPDANTPTPVAVPDITAAPTPPRPAAAVAETVTGVSAVSPRRDPRFGLSRTQLGGIGLAIMAALAGWRLWRGR